VFGSLNGAAYISTGFDINSNPTGHQNQKFTVLTNGNVGIGTTSPNHKLDINTGRGNLKTYSYGLEHTVNTTGGWARGFRLRNENDNKTTVFGSLNGAAYISTGFDINSNPTGHQNQKFTVLTNGNVGIGTTSPKHKLDINTGAGNLKTYTYGLEHTVNTTGAWARAFRLRNENDNKTVAFGSHNGNAYISTGFDISENATGHRYQKFTINRNGNAALKGKFEAKEIKVTNTPTADFVFEENYNLPSLKSIEKHIKEKRHLPEIASAKEMEKNGVNIGDFQIQLLQKIEELTLYTIEQGKKIKSLEGQNSKIEKQQKDIEELKTLVKQLLKGKN
ncbi:hypothetical protein G1K53_12755, partial [Tenacibaculum finnmarkense]